MAVADSPASAASATSSISYRHTADAFNKVFRSREYDSRFVAQGCRLGTTRPAPGRVEGPVEVSIASGCPDNRKRDLDNAATKAALDLLVEHQSHQLRLADNLKHLAWDTTVPAGRAIIIVKTAIATAAGSVRF